MPFPILQPKIEQASSTASVRSTSDAALPVGPAGPGAPASKCRIFVSYSHLDTPFAREFMKYLKLKLRELDAALQIAESHVFFDRNKLLAGDDWDESIQTALDQMEYFILLLSANSLISKYCIDRELTQAVRRGIPIVQILLQPCPWEDLPLPGDAKQRKFGALGALPKDDSFCLQAIEHWERGMADAWTTTVGQLAQRLLEERGQSPLPNSVASQPRAATNHRATSLLPYFCNQVASVNGFNGRLRAWQTHALLVLSRGQPLDNVPRFWDRLRTKNLADYLSMHNAQLLEPRPLIWPQETGHRRDAAGLASDMLGALSEALTGSSFQLKDPAAIGQWLTAQAGVVPLVTTLPRDKKSVVAQGLKVLLDVLEQSAPPNAPHRLVVAAVLENDALAGEKDLIKALKLTGYSHTHVVDVLPLQEIEEEDIRRWHREHQIQSLCRLSEEELLAQVLSDTVQRLRLGTFEVRLRPILGL